MGRWKYRKHKIFLCFNGGHCFTHLNQSELADYFRNNWSYHCFRPNGETKPELYTLLADEKFVAKTLHASKGLFVDTDCLKIGQWYPSLILAINWDQGDMLVTSMHNSGYDKNCFFWPPRDNIYYAPFTHIIGLTKVPNIVGRHGQNSYKISAKLNYLTKIYVNCWTENNKVQLYWKYQIFIKLK